LCGGRALPLVLVVCRVDPTRNPTCGLGVHTYPHQPNHVTPATTAPAAARPRLARRLAIKFPFRGIRTARPPASSSARAASRCCHVAPPGFNACACLPSRPASPGSANSNLARTISPSQIRSTSRHVRSIRGHWRRCARKATMESRINSPRSLSLSLVYRTVD
jgi:hypothetical protein